MISPDVRITKRYNDKNQSKKNIYMGTLVKAKVRDMKEKRREVRRSLLQIKRDWKRDKRHNF